ncbi:hypothetical protein PILCRDRAFT_821493 [Piloderma croceum F 1598]|uniref:Uncharacterized protein n=1 Tax=Piloderma croceum (strain F 1598) TaxID=765440 RepID=A0A0C3B582_PILCF|nr:hypothetical protein PILCRDRAFT_821493 [Piloderma croceum F 1598]
MTCARRRRLQSIQTALIAVSPYVCIAQAIFYGTLDDARSGDAAVLVAEPPSLRRPYVRWLSVERRFIGYTGSCHLRALSDRSGLDTPLFNP